MTRSILLILPLLALIAPGVRAEDGHEASHVRSAERVQSLAVDFRTAALQTYELSGDAHARHVDRPTQRRLQSLARRAEAFAAAVERSGGAYREAKDEFAYLVRAFDHAASSLGHSWGSVEVKRGFERMGVAMHDLLRAYDYRPQPHPPTVLDLDDHRGKEWKDEF